jgi:hypothetical protein
MKKGNINSTLAWTKYIFSSMVLCSFIFLCGCDIGDFDFNLNLAGGAPGGGGNYWIDPGQGTVYADSVISSEDDSITMYGHFSTWKLNTKIQIIEYGIAVYKDYMLFEKIALVRNAEWEFNDTNSSIPAKAKIASIKQNAVVYFTVYYIAKNSQGFEARYESPLLIIKEFEPAFTAIHDSVTFSGDDKAILWGHLETKKDCEIMSVKVIWGLLYNATNADSINVPQYMKANEIIAVRDTILVGSNQIYEWHIEAVAEFANDSLAYTSYLSNQFMKEN